MDEGVLLHGSHGGQILFQITTRSTSEETDVSQLTGLVSFLVLHVLVGLEEGMELVIEINLSVLHGDKHLQLLFEGKEGLVRPSLLGHEAIDVLYEGLDITFSPVLYKKRLDTIIVTYFINRDSDAVYSQLILSAGSCNITQELLDVARGSDEDLHFST